MKFDRISVIFRLHGLSAVFRNFLKNVKTLEPKTYITILSIPSVISGRNIKGSIFPTLCHIFSISLGPYRESLLMCLSCIRTFFAHLIQLRRVWMKVCFSPRGHGNELAIWPKLLEAWLALTKAYGQFFARGDVEPFAHLNSRKLTKFLRSSRK